MQRQPEPESSSEIKADSNDELWTKAQVAKFLHRTERSVESFVAKGIIPAIRLTPRTVLFHRKSVEKALLELQTGGCAR